MPTPTSRNARAFLTGILIANFGVMAAYAQPQAAAPEDRDRAQAADFITLHSDGLNSMLVDEKDQGLLKALQLIDERIRELPRETRQRDMPAPAITFLLELLQRPLQLRLGLMNNFEIAENMDRPPLHVQLLFPTSDMEEAQSLTSRFSAIIKQIAPEQSDHVLPMDGSPGMQTLDLDGTPLYFGATTLRMAGEPAASQAAFIIALNQIDPSAAKPLNVDLPNAEQALAVRIDLRALAPLIDKMAAQHEADPDLNMLLEQLRAWRLYGPDALTVTSALGFAPDRAVGMTRLTNYGALLREHNGLARQPLTAADLKRIPADATFAQITRYRLASIGEMMSQQAQLQGVDPMAEIETRTGINPKRDIFDHLGETIGIYTSRSTGGGGLLSGVLFVEVSNVEAFSQTITRLTEMFNQMAMFAGRGYVRIALRTVGEQPMQVLAFPGLPIPLELCFAIADGYWYAALSPQSLITAVEQGRGGKPGLTEHAGFAKAGGDWNNAIRVTFLDAPELLAEGYATVNLLTAALSNAVRSPAQPDRGVPMIMPPLPELAKNARPFVSIQRVDGDDIVETGQWDRSLLVNACGVVGLLRGVGPFAAAVLPAMQKARQQAAMHRHEQHENHNHHHGDDHDGDDHDDHHHNDDHHDQRQHQADPD